MIGNVVAVITPNANLWHLRIGHISEGGLNKLVKQGILPSEAKLNLQQFDHCILGKQYRQSYKSSEATSHGILYYIHVDLWGPTRT